MPAKSLPKPVTNGELLALYVDLTDRALRMLINKQISQTGYDAVLACASHIFAVYTDQDAPTPVIEK